MLTGADLECQFGRNEEPGRRHFGRRMGDFGAEMGRKTRIPGEKGGKWRELPGRGQLCRGDQKFNLPLISSHFRRFQVPGSQVKTAGKSRQRCLLPVRAVFAPPSPNRFGAGSNPPSCFDKLRMMLQEAQDERGLWSSWLQDSGVSGRRARGRCQGITN